MELNNQNIVAVLEKKIVPLQIDTTYIRQEASGVIKGMLSASGEDIAVFANEPFISLTLKEQADVTQIHYEMDVSPYKPGETITGQIVVFSAYGEAVIPVELKVSAAGLTLPDGEVLYTLAEFAYYASKDIGAAKKIFVSDGFNRWLGTMDIKLETIYMVLMMDTNKYRALDNFLIMAGYKNKTGIKLSRKDIVVELAPHEKSYTGVIPIEQDGWGYVEGFCKTKSVRWLKLFKEDFNSLDFNVKGVHNLIFTVDAKEIQGYYGFTALYLQVGDDIQEMNISVKKKPLVAVSLSKSSYGADDYGSVLIENHGLEDVVAEVWCKDNCIHFDSRKYYVTKKSEIPFSIKVPTLTRFNQFSIKKIPVFETEIYIRIKGELHTLQVYAGNLLS